jgi:hypothetical protein
MDLYWDYVNGSTSYLGTSARRPLKTVAQVNAAVAAALAGNPRAQVNLFGNTEDGPAWFDGTVWRVDGRVNFVGYGTDDANGLFDGRPYKQLANTNFSRPNAGTYPTVWGIADSEPRAGVWEDVGWGGNETPLVAYAPVTAANLAAALPLLHATAGTFWTDGTTLYIHPWGNTNPTTDGKTYVRSVIASYVTVLGVGVSVAPAVLLTGAGFRVRRLAVGGMAETADANNTYGILIVPTQRGAGEVENGKAYNCGWHQAGVVEFGTGGTVTRADYAIRRLAFPQASDWASIVPFVFSAHADATGMTLDLDDLSQPQAYQLPGSSAGQTPAFAPVAVFAHGGALTGEPAAFARVRIRNADCAGGLSTAGINQMVADGGLLVSGGRFGGSCDLGTTATVEGVRLGAMPVPTAAGKTLTARNCVVVPFDRGQSAVQAAGSTLDFQYGALDCSNSPDVVNGDNGTVYGYVARATNAAAVSLTVANSLVVLTTRASRGDGGCMMAIFRNTYPTTDALTIDGNNYVTRYIWQPPIIANADAVQPRMDDINTGVGYSWGGTQDVHSRGAIVPVPPPFVPAAAGYAADYTQRVPTTFTLLNARTGPYDSPLAQSADGTPEARLLAKLDAAREAADRAEAASAWAVDTNVVALNGGPVGLVDPSTLTGNVTVSPFVASVTNPRYATRDLPPIPSGSSPTDQWAVVDGTGAAVDLSGKTIRFVALSVVDAGVEDDRTDDQLVGVYQYQTGTDDNIEVAGAGHNVVRVTHDAARTATPGEFRYELWNVTDNLVLAAGRLPVRPAVKAVA